MSEVGGVCTHGVTFDAQAAEDRNIRPSAVRTLWPRLDGACPMGCGYEGIAYASFAHYLWGNW